MSMFDRRNNTHKKQSRPVSTTIMPSVQPPPAPPGRQPAERPRRYEAFNLQGIGTCTEQEDSFAFANVTGGGNSDENGILAVVGDGMGGMSGGKLASSITVDTFKSDFGNYDLAGDIPEQLCESALRADRTVFGKLDANGGSTLVACIIYDGALYCISIGDSFLFLRRNGVLLHLNREHDILHEHYLDAVRRGKISLKQVVHTQDDHAITQFIGCGRLDDPDLLRRPLRLFAGDTIMLCSDGISDVLTRDEIAESLDAPTLSGVCEELERKLHASAEGRYRDNYTALVIKCLN